ncbi:hypothetical protein MRB53_037652 [Persea americana]|nr:hypothetical protein MRB53_037652 [Persea americana]
MRDVEMYKRSTEDFMRHFNRLVEGFVSQIDNNVTSAYPEIEFRWRRFSSAVREVTAVAYAEHEAAVRKNCIDPMMTLLKLHESPQKLMQKRKKRLVEWAKYKAMKDRGDKLDKKTIEQGEQFIALNETLKDELPKLFRLTGKLVGACLKSYIQIQTKWHYTWQEKIKSVIDEHDVSFPISSIVDSYLQQFADVEAQTMALGICNGSIMADAPNYLVCDKRVSVIGPGKQERLRQSAERVAATVGRAAASCHQRHDSTSTACYQIPCLEFGDCHAGTAGFKIGFAYNVLLLERQEPWSECESTI